MNLQQLLNILRLRWLMMLIVIAVTVGGTYTVSRFLPRIYVAEASLMIEMRSDPLMSTFMPQLVATSYLGTQADIIKSERVAAQVVQMLGLDKQAESVTMWRNDTEGKVPIDRYFGELLLKSLKVEGGRFSNVVTISYGSEDPKFSAAATNAFVQAYISTSASLRADPAKSYAGYFESQAKTYREELDRAQAKLTEYQNKHGIVASPQRLDAESTRLDALNLQLAQAMAERTEASARQTNSGAETSPDVQNSPSVQALKGQLAAAESKLTEISSVVGSRHPQRLLLEAQIEGLREQLAAEMRRVTGATATVGRQSNQKVAEIRALVEQQKRTVLAMRTQLDEMATLYREVEAAQRAFSSVTDRRNQVTLESKSDQAAARIISPAIEPLEPAKPRVGVMVGISVAFGVAFAVALALGLELLDRRLRSPADLTELEGIPLLGVISPSAKPGRGQTLPIALMRPRARPAPQLTMNGESS